MLSGILIEFEYKNCICEENASTLYHVNIVKKERVCIKFGLYCYQVANNKDTAITAHLHSWMLWFIYIVYNIILVSSNII